MSSKPTLALIAHDAKKDELVAWAQTHAETIARYRLYATGTTGSRLQKALPQLDLTLLKSGPLGGDQQIGAAIAEGRVDGVIFLVDGLSAMPHDVDVKALMRIAVIYDVPLALNLATANLVIAGLLSTGHGQKAVG